MGLAKSCEGFLNNVVLVKPVYGWGWARFDKPEIPVPAEVNGVPLPLNGRITEFCYHHSELNGAIGKIEAANHIYDSLWTFFYLRVQGMFNFTDEIGYYNIEIGSHPPEVSDEKDWLKFTLGSPIVNGYAHIAESFHLIKKYEARQHEKWEIMRDAMNDQN